jgi:hydrogenase maturation protease
MRIIGCGNLDRGDDAAGVLVARRLCELGVEAIVQTGEASSLIEAWSGADDVVVVDAVVTGSPVGTVRMWAGRPPSLPRKPVSSHGFGVAEAFDLAEALGRLPRRFRLYGIEGKEFAPGGPVSPEVLRAVQEVAQKIAAEAGK